MNSREAHPSAWPLRIYLIASAATAIAALVVGVERIPPPRDEAEPLMTAPHPVASPEPIAAEADVFRPLPGALALGPEAPRRRSAHPRNLSTFRFLRAYPGAPPRIPHGLSSEELRTGVCGTCHERGGYSLRFAAYVPVTPHPELGMCLQCHPVDDAVAGVVSPGADPNTRCPQCHGPEGRVRPEKRLAASLSAWSEPGDRTAGGLPPTIPHDRDMRGNCLACHAGPAAVAEIRTSHPEWTSCRQCHVETGLP